MADSQNPAASTSHAGTHGTPGMAPARTGNAAFVTHFMPGLIIGLLVGGLAGAFLPVLLERDGIPSGGANVKGEAAPRAVDRDARDSQGDPGLRIDEKPIEEVVPGETEPTDPTKPATTPATTPGTPPPPAEPVTTPAKPPAHPK